MAEVIRMPLLSDTMKEGKIASWLKKVGDNVKSDDVLAEVETDKATMEVIGYADGVLLHIGVPAGEAAKIDEIIAIVGKQGEDISSLLNNETKVEKPAPIAKEDAPAQKVAQNISLPKELKIITMPLLSDTMKEGKIASWLKNVGDTVKDDEVIAEVETDKATMEVIGYENGTLLYKGAEAGNAVLVNGTLAVIGPKDFDIKPFLSAINASPSVNADNLEELPKAANTAIENIAVKDDSNTLEANGRVKASPLAKKIAQEKGLNLNIIPGTGDGGRIVMKDVLNAKLESVSEATAPTITTASPVSVSGVEGYFDIPVTQMRQIIAQRLGESMFTAPHFYLKNTVTLDNLLALRKQINEAQPIKVSINDMIIKAAALSLQKHPEINSSWLGDKIRTYNHVNIGSAIALPEGLIVPVIKHANLKSITQIATDANTLYDKAKNKKIQPSEFTGNTFTISNLGMMDIDEFTAIINPPDACILAVGKGVATPVVDDNGQIVVKTQLKLTLSCDHRVVDGAVGANFLKTLKGYLEQPVTMLV